MKHRGFENLWLRGIRRVEEGTVDISLSHVDGTLL